MSETQAQAPARRETAPSGAAEDVLSVYRDRLRDRTAALEAADKTADLIGNVRLALAAVALLLVILPLFIRHGGPWWGLIAAGVVFVILGQQHDRAFMRQRRLRASVRFYRQGLDRLDEKWRSFEDDGADLGSEMRERAIYADDLDLFGPASLFQLITRASTRLGRRVLGTWLVEPASRAEIARRQPAVVELRDQLEVREELIASAAGDDASPLEDAKLLEWAEKSAPLPRAGLLRVLGIVQPILLIASAVFVWAGGMGIVLVVAIVLHLATLFLTRKITNERAKVLSGPDRALSRYATMIGAVEKMRFQAPLLAELKGRLVDPREGAPPASEQIRSLHSLVNLLDARLNVFFALSVGPITMWDLNLVLRAERFRVETGPKLRGWLNALAELEALSSFAALACERRDYVMPELVEGTAKFEADALAHPLIDRRRVVANDLTLAGPGAVLLLSGSNMSGKSTLLRAVGINCVLARAGCVVAARRLSLAMMQLATSVRIVDSLAGGTSHFYAELKRIKFIVDAAAKNTGEPVLYLLDEMLHGTNSRERYIGAVSVIRWLSAKGATGIVTTHDLALAKIEQELAPGLARNMHFGDEVRGGEIHFDYRLKQGPVSSTNALRLMRAVGIDVEITS